ncbi:MAG: cupin domain-containing protein [Clostridia bacterium]|nr:cupin domain-containing protein [Clostridia bacterium]
MEIGLKIKNLRLTKNLTQEELADRCELTKGYISQLENDLTSPSIETLKDLLNALGTNFSQFFEDESDTQIVFKKDEHIEKLTADTKTTWLVPTSQKNSMEPIVVELQPSAQTEKDLAHEGEEFGLVLKGKIELTVGKKTYIVNQKETFYFVANKPHYIKNISNTESKILWVSCPPNF